MAQHLLILLLGGREQPALLTAAHLEPDAVLCIAPHGNSAPRKVAAWLSEFLPRTAILPPQEVPPYRSQETLATILAVMEEHKEYAPLVSLISAPQPMVIGGYEAARQLECPAYYLDTGAAELLDLTPGGKSEEIIARLNVQEFARVNNVKVRDAAPPADWDGAQKKHKAARDAICADVQAGAALLNWLPRRDTSFTWKGDWAFVEPVAPGARALLVALNKCGVISHLQWSDAGGTTQVEVTVSDRADALFLMGFWLEQFVYEVACAARLPDGMLLFDECAWGLHYDAQGRAHREVDFIGVRGGTGLIASCKTSKDPWVKNNLGEVVSVGIPLGGDYLAKMYVTNQFRPQPGTQLYGKYVEFMDWAVSQNVTVVTGDDLTDLQMILRQAAAGARK